MNKKTVIVTGGSRGIGRAISSKFASNNYNVVINYKSNDLEANKVKKELEEKYNIDVLLVKADLSNEEEIKRIINKTKEEFNQVDVLINNAGICKDAPLEDKTKENFMNILNVNLVAPFLLCKYAANELINSNGSIINITSTNAIDSYYPDSLDYDASKAGLINLTKNLAMYFAPNVRVNAVAPGWTNTDMTKDLDPKYRKEEENNVLLKRFASPEEIANVVYFLASKEASYINGEIISVDGGKNGY